MPTDAHSPCGRQVLPTSFHCLRETCRKGRGQTFCESFSCQDDSASRGHLLKSGQGSRRCVCGARHTDVYLTKQGTASTPTARKGVRSPINLIYHKSVTASSQSSEIRRKGERSGLYSPRACEQIAIASPCVSREHLDLHGELARSFGNTNASARCWRGSKPSRRRRSAWSQTGLH